MTYDYRFSGCNGQRGDSVPALAMDEHLASRGEVRLGYANFANEALYTGDDFVPTRA
jgi:hypothetical protein